MGRTDVQTALFAIIHQKGISIAQKQIASKPLTLERLFPPEAQTIEKAHGRLEIRKIWTSTEINNFVLFPH